MRGRTLHIRVEIWVMVLLPEMHKKNCENMMRNS